MRHHQHHHQHHDSNIKQIKVTPAMGTIVLGDAGPTQMSVMVHTGAVMVTISDSATPGHRDAELLPCGLDYVTATVETGEGELIALTDTRFEESIFAEGWR
jgi:hypothetical protein